MKICLNCCLLKLIEMGEDFFGKRVLWMKDDRSNVECVLYFLYWKRVVE